MPEERKVFIGKGEAATYVEKAMGGWTATARWKSEHARAIWEHPSASCSPLGEREVTQKTSALQRFMKYWFILAEACLWWSGKDHKQKAYAPHPVAAAGAVHPPGTKKAFLLFSLSSGGRQAGK